MPSKCVVFIFSKYIQSGNRRTWKRCHEIECKNVHTSSIAGKHKCMIWYLLTALMPICLLLSVVLYRMGSICACQILSHRM